MEEANFQLVAPLKVNKFNVEEENLPVVHFARE